jgi:serine/threonine protein kinase
MSKTSSLRSIRLFRYDLPPNISNSAREFIDACLTKDYHQRPTAEDLIQHPFVNDVHTHAHIHHHHEQTSMPVLF